MRNSSLVERPGVENDRASSHLPKLCIVLIYQDSGRGAYYSAVKVWRRAMLERVVAKL